MLRGAMSERTRAGSGLRSSADAAPSPEDVRRKLEGRVEVVEAARARYAALEALLGGGRWKRRLRREPDTVREVLAQEAVLTEALGRIRRRAETEGWPEETPVLALVRDVTLRRARLEALARQRLGTLATPTGEPSLEADLPRLEALVSRPLPVAPAPGEVRLLQHTKQDPNQGQALLPISAVLGISFALSLAFPRLMGEVGTLITVGAFLVQVLVILLQAGEYWLTSERLVWKPLLGEPVAVPLRSIPAGGVHVHRGWGTVRVEGERTLRMRFVPEAERLAAILEMHRQAPFLGASRAGLKLADVSFYPVTLREGGAVKKGWAVLRPRGVSFLPEGTGVEVLKAVTGAEVTPGLRVEVDWVVDQLRWLPEEEFDAAVERAVAAVGGERWSVWDTEHRADVPVWRDIRLVNGAKVMSGKVDWSQQAQAEKVLASWAR